MPSRLPHRRRLLTRAALVAALALGFAVGGPVAALASPPAAPAAAASDGFLRLGHFSPDTAKVDVRVTALSGGSTVLSLQGVGYGDVSPYSALPAGTYTVAMVGAGTNAWASPVISAKVTIKAGTAATVAAYGPNADLKVTAFTDDLTAPTSGAARVRVIQASTITPTVSVATSAGTQIARNAARGSSSSYVTVPAGSTSFQLSGSNVSDSATLDLAAGSVTTLFVLDTSSRGLTLLPVLDSATAAVVPDGGIDTGGGGMAGHLPAKRAAVLAR